MQPGWWLFRSPQHPHIGWAPSAYVEEIRADEDNSTPGRSILPPHPSMRRRNSTDTVSTVDDVVPPYVLEDV